MAGRETFRRQWNSTPLGPCASAPRSGENESRCRHYGLCARELMACRAYRLFVQGKQHVSGRHWSDLPSRRLFEEAMSGRDDDE